MSRPQKLPPGMVKRGSVYYARFRANGREVKKRLSSDLKTAKELLHELRARADKADYNLLDNDYSWKTLKAEFLRWKRQTSRMGKEYESDLGQFEKYSAISSVRQITQDYITGFRAWRMAGKRPVTAKTINKQVGILHHMLNMAVEWKRIGSNPIEGIKPLPYDTRTKVRRSLTLDEVQALFDASPAWLRPVWRMFMVTGLRKEELVGLKFSDVDLERRTITVRAENAKSRREREIPLDDSAVETIAALAASAKARQPVKGQTEKITAQQKARFSREHVFVSNANTPLRNNLLTRFYTVCKRAGITDACPGGSVDIHSLRVSFTTLSIDHGASPKAIQAILGHATLAMTMGVYARATERGKRDAISALPFASVSAPKHLVALNPGTDAAKLRPSKKARS